MKPLRVPGIVNLVEVSDPADIEALSNNPAVDRDFDLRTVLVNRILLWRSLSALSVHGRRFPTMTPRDSEDRAAQQVLWTSLTEKAESVRSGPAELEPLAVWVTGVGPDDRVGILAQQLLGRLFLPDFTASSESWAAAQVFVAAPRSWKPKALWCLLSGRVHRAKRLLATMVRGDLAAFNAIGIAVHNLVKGIRRMRLLYADSPTRSSLTPPAAARECLFAPVSVYRQTTATVASGNYALPRKTLFVFDIGVASRQQGGRPLVFMENSWSRCPAAQWVPAMLEGLWRRAIDSSGRPDTQHAET